LPIIYFSNYIYKWQDELNEEEDDDHHLKECLALAVDLLPEVLLPDVPHQLLRPVPLPHPELLLPPHPVPLPHPVVHLLPEVLLPDVPHLLLPQELPPHQELPPLPHPVPHLPVDLKCMTYEV
jgi:hypothetical protein